jgi:hypothetical protein
MNSVIGSPDPLGRAVTLVATCILVATLSVPIHGSAWASCPRSVRPSLDTPRSASRSSVLVTITPPWGAGSAQTR